MKLSIHPSAADNFNSKAEELISCIVVAPRATDKVNEFKSDVHIATTLTDEDVVGEIQESSSDFWGNTSERFFHHDGTRYGILSGNYLRLIELSELIRNHQQISTSLSSDFVEKCLFEWMKKRFLGEEIESAFVHYLKAHADTKIENFRVYVPVANLEIEGPFDFGGSSICTVSKKMIDKWTSKFEGTPEEKKLYIDPYVEQFRKDFQGYAAIVVDVVCEANYATIVAAEQARRVTSLLGIFSPAILTPNVKCVSQIKGTEHNDTYTTILQAKSGNFNVNNQIIDLGSAKIWKISQEELTDIKNCGLQNLSEALTNKKPNDFQMAVLNMAFLYSKAAFTSDPMAKIIATLTALESVLLKNRVEPIQQNLSERIALLSPGGLGERKSIIKNIKQVYDLRSRYLHHGYLHDEFSSKELDMFTEFLSCAWRFFGGLLDRINHYETTEEFLTAIDDYKLR